MAPRTLTSAKIARALNRNLNWFSRRRGHLVLFEGMPRPIERPGRRPYWIARAIEPWIAEQKAAREDAAREAQQ